jgi:hypothetical protein
MEDCEFPNVSLSIKYSLRDRKNSKESSFGDDTTNGSLGLTQSDGQSRKYVAWSLIPATLLANSAQIVLTFSYLLYNVLFTRLLAAKEWASMSMSFKPLRVTAPRGQQVSSYRLQLPYSYSVPLLGLSTLLHWLVSNSIFLSITAG